MITRQQLIKKYIEFFKSKNHKEIPNASLIPENDPTVLFTTAGMHPLVPYLTGQKHPLGKRLVNVQRCIRTGDIEEVGDDTHLTFFEMLGNWSLGDYWKKEAIEFSYEFLTKELKIDLKKLSVTCFRGENNIPKDKEAEEIWKSLGIKKIKFLGKKDNWWGPAGKTGPCGPDSEMFIDGIEIWNDVFMQYNKSEKSKYESLKQKNVDTGMGVERTLAIINNQKNVYETELFKPIIKKIEHLSSKKYEDHKKEMRIIADHIKTSVFILAEGIVPGNSEQGYVLRRLIRRTIMNLRKLGFVGTDLINPIAEEVFKIYDYPELEKNKDKIYNEINKEEEQFQKTLEKGLSIFNKTVEKEKKLSGKKAFLLYQSYGFPIELTQELAQDKNIKINLKEFEKELAKHQKLSRTATKGKFKAGLADNSETTARLHTATHLLHTALRKILGNHVQQMGSNITPERLRFDFSHDKKLTEEEKQKIEDLVNKQISKGQKVEFKEMSYDEAAKLGALSFFREKYPEIVKVYSVGNFSKEICAGPHVKNTKEIGNFKIQKESSSSAGVRRIKAILK
ncbi:alanine--tRNA ligase [Candidatus Pacearchaeota archaeon]|nr:alanine--tRNA ligase [Candidatus Pacearchaeota archaeon]